MRTSARLLSNATTTYLRMGSTFALGLFATWYILGAVGVIGFGLMALAVSGNGLSRALERSLRFGLVRELAAAIATGETRAIRCSLTAAFRLCLQTAMPLAALTVLLAILARSGAFNTPADRPELAGALAILILAEGLHDGVRLLAAPYLQALFAAQEVALDNLLVVLARGSYALSAVLVFGWLLAGRDLDVQLAGFAASRVTLQLVDVALGIWLARRRIPGLRLDRSAYDHGEYLSIRGTVWHSSQVFLLLNLNPQLLAVLINLFFGLAYNGIWQIVIQFSGFARMFSEGLLRGIGPLATHLDRGGRRRTVIELMSRSIRYQLAVALPAALLLGIYVRPLLDLWVGSRLAVDPRLAAAGLPAAEALGLAATMAVILLVAQTLRAIFFGVERILYAVGEVRSYAWFAKWATVITVVMAAVLMPWSGTPIAAALALLVSQSLFSPLVVLRAAHRTVGLPIGASLRRGLPRPALAGAGLLVLLLAARSWLDELTPATLAALLAGACGVYGALALVLVPIRDERARFAELLWQRSGDQGAPPSRDRQES